MHPLYPDKLRLKTIIVEKKNNNRNKNIYFEKEPNWVYNYVNSASNSKGFDKKRKILMEVVGGGVGGWGG